MITRATRVRGFNLVMVLLITLWIAVLVFTVSSLMVDFLYGTFTLLTALSGVTMALVCLPLAVVIHLENADKAFQKITLGLVEFIAIIMTAGVVMFVISPVFSLDWLYVVGQIMWFGAYAAILLPLCSGLRLQRKKLDRKIDLLLLAICVVATAIVLLSVIAVYYRLPLNGFNILTFAGFTILDIIALTLLSKLVLINMPNIYRYFYALLFIFFFLDFLPDLLNLYVALNMGSALAIDYNHPFSQVLYGLAEVFLTAGLVLYSSRNINTETVEEVRETLQDTRRLMNDVIAQSPDAICICDTEGNPLTMNDAFRRVFRESRRDGQDRHNLFEGTLGLNLPGQELARVRAGETVILPSVKTLPEERYLSLKLYPTYNSKGVISGYVIVAEDITERTKAERQVKDSLEEKKVLLKEIHHRVKNNLQIISSLLNVQSSYVTDQAALECFKESQQRVKSMALIHEKLYQSEDLSRVNFTEYLGNLSASLFRTYNVSDGNIGLNVEVDDVTIDIDRAIPCGLIVNELVSNSLKHAFPGGRGGEVDIQMSRSADRYLLTVRDNGIGFPAAVDYRNTNTLGMQLIGTLVTQLDGTLEMDRNAGTRFFISFPAQGK